MFNPVAKLLEDRNRLSPHPTETVLEARNLKEAIEVMNVGVQLGHFAVVVS